MQTRCSRLSVIRASRSFYIHLPHGSRWFTCLLLPFVSQHAPILCLYSGCHLLSILSRSSAPSSRLASSRSEDSAFHSFQILHKIDEEQTFLVKKTLFHIARIWLLIQNQHHHWCNAGSVQPKVVESTQQ